MDTSPNNTILTTVVERLEPDGSIPIPAQEAMIKELRNVIKYDVWEPVSKNQRINKAIKSFMLAVEKFTADGIFDKWKGRLAGKHGKHVKKQDQNRYDFSYNRHGEPFPINKHC
jgi:hypothetical protein